jgi:hypothetical protein
MDEVWYSAVAEELARCLADAGRCADACEALLERSAEEQHAVRAQLTAALVAPAAVSRVLVDLIDHPRALVLAGATLCRDATAEAAAALTGMTAAAAAVEALRACSASCDALLAAAAAG